MPERIQLSRRKGWRKPENTVVVSRPSKWGNPFPADVEPFTRADAVRMYRELVVDRVAWLVTDAGTRWEHRNRFTPERLEATTRGGLRTRRVPTAADVRAELAGKNLACWCPLDQPCHADVLLEIANGADHA